MQQGGKAPKAVSVSGEGLGSWAALTQPFHAPAPPSAEPRVPLALPDYSPLLRDTSDPRYALSIDADDPAAAAAFFHQVSACATQTEPGKRRSEYPFLPVSLLQHGYVVLRGVYDALQCRRTRAAMWAVVERANPGLCAADRRTWGAMKGSGKYGLSQRGPCFDPVLVDNRQSPRLAPCLAAVVGCPLADLLVSQDRFTIYRATVDGDCEDDGGGDGGLGAQFATGRRNVHLDLNPWWWQEGSAEVVAKVTSVYSKGC